MTTQSVLRMTGCYQRASPWLASTPLWRSQCGIRPLFLTDPSQSCSGPTTTGPCSGFVVGIPPLLVRFHSTNPDRQSSNNSNSNSSNVFMEFIASMRWKATNALTSSLSNEERTLLLQRLDKHHSKDTSSTNNPNQKQSKTSDDMDVQHTIAEAVAAARVQEAQRSQQKWQAQKEALLKEAETAARARVEADLAIQRRRVQFDQWQAQVEQAKNKVKPVGDDGDAASSPEEKQQGPQSQQLQQQDQDTSSHPLLGPCVLDLGYKRIHVVGTEALTAIPVWEKQVLFCIDRNTLIDLTFAITTPHFLVLSLLVVLYNRIANLST